MISILFIGVSSSSLNILNHFATGNSFLTAKLMQGWRWRRPLLLSFCIIDNRLFNSIIPSRDFTQLSTMVSRKKAAGKARKAKKAAKAEANEERNDPTTIMRQLNQLQCKHGAELLSSNDVCLQFALALRKSFSVCKDTLLDRLFDARKALLHEFADVWNDTAKLEIAIAFFFCVRALKMFSNAIMQMPVILLRLPDSSMNISQLS